LLFAVVIREKELLQIESTVKATFYKVKMGYASNNGK
jgi:hypothetical protein